MEKNFSDYAIEFNQKLLSIEKRISVSLPTDYKLMNPFCYGQALTISQDFYRKFYSDKKKRKIIFGINPGRHGAGKTGVPFTDSKKLQQLGLDSRGIESYETSAVFIYQMIEKYGGVEKFYLDFYFNSPLPLGLLYKNSKNNWVNANYYDKADLLKATQDLIDFAMQSYQKMPLQKSVAYCLGQGKNYQFLQKYNQEKKIYQKIVALPHPRYIMQYKSKQLDFYLQDYCQKLAGN